MSIPKVSYELMQGMVSFNNLIEQLKIALDGIPNQSSAGKDWYGFTIYIDENAKKKPNNYIGWVGSYYEGNRLVFEYGNKDIVKFIKDNCKDDFVLSENKKNFLKFFDFEENHFFSYKPDDQVSLLKKWVKENYNNSKELFKKASAVNKTS